MIESPLFYQDKPLFGFDIGYNTIKVIQIDSSKKKQSVLGYGITSYNPKHITDGVITNPEAIAKEVYTLISTKLIGSIDTRRIATSVPASHSYNRVVNLPLMPKSGIREAIELEAEQYIPVPLNDLYLDYEITETKQDGTQDILVVATPKKIVDSYLTLFEILGLEPAIIETSISAVTRLAFHGEKTEIPTLIVDFGASTTDLSIYDHGLRVTGSVSEGGDDVTAAIMKEINVSSTQALTIKNKFGISPGKRQKDIANALEPLLSKMISEIKKMTRFYQERSDKSRSIEQIIILGGGANMPGLADYITDKIRIPTRMCDPWANLHFGKLQPPHRQEKTLYTTATGLALIQPKEVHYND